MSQCPPPLPPWSQEVVKHSGRSAALAGHPWLYMRWKERYFLKGSESRLTIAGFYYLALHRWAGRGGGVALPPCWWKGRSGGRAGAAAGATTGGGWRAASGSLTDAGPGQADRWPTGVSGKRSAPCLKMILYLFSLTRRAFSAAACLPAGSLAQSPAGEQPPPLPLLPLSWASGHAGASAAALEQRQRLRGRKGLWQLPACLPACLLVRLHQCTDRWRGACPA